MKAINGFTFIELIVTLVLIGILASIVLPTATILTRQSQERELKEALLEIRSAIDHYKIASDHNEINSAYKTGTGYPPNLKSLEGVPSQYGSKTLRFIRKIPRDPFSDSKIDSEKTWILRSYESEYYNPQAGDNVYDIYSSSTGKGSNGIPYNNW
ncbi:hypothetical protein ASC84_19970 [Acinetobacter sp. Root1280]|uniref:type II secretion system protein n=1 Tax=Acinetobacter sp. Root1280 TaxID=1736444 RepID=UPI0006FA2E2E|nr:type II secretion system protein [Acinetobacter sp. Root1280]KQW99769.1 hypothetical protein ASC84_19970 [Acinetobacter sp. Root1280]